MTDISPPEDLGTFHDLLKAFAAALAPHMGTVAAPDEEAITSIVSDYLQNENVLTGDNVDDAIEQWVSNSDDLVNTDNVAEMINEELSYNCSDYGILTNDSFDPDDHDVVTNYSLDESVNRILSGFDWASVITREVLASAIAGSDYVVSKRESQAA
jgi:hypothetical protein